jgi:hypothetical protein
MKMETITNAGNNVYFIDSEPGDATHYSFLIYRDGLDRFSFAPRGSTFNFPQRIDFWGDVKDIDDAGILEIAKKFNCNPCTVKECIRILILLRDQE